METSTPIGLRSLLDKGKLFFKAGIIFVMALILLIPASFVTDLVNERQSRQKEAILDISSKWGGRQTVVSPFLAVPYNERTINAEGRTILVKGKAYFLPKAVRTNVKVIPEKRYRGIYQVVVYRSEISLQGEFGPLNYQSLKIDPSDMLWNEAAIVYKVSDNQRGINEDVNLHWDDSTVNFQAQESQQSFLNDAFSASLPLNAETITRSHAFSMKFTLNGSEQLLFATNAKETDLKMQSDWEAPSFSGVKLPDNREINDKGFTAHWKFLNRSIPMAWKDDRMDFETTALGADLKIPVDGYDKTLRAVKHAILCIILTFAAFFLIETIYRRYLHLVHYALAGLALVLFYTLLLSISEYSSFSIAYLVAGIATIGLVTWFIGSILRSGKLSVFIAFVLSVVYSYIFCIIQLEDYALLMGSVGLFITLGIIMYFSRKLNWG